MNCACEESLFLRGACTILYGNQFCNALSFRILVSLADFLKMDD